MKGSDMASADKTNDWWRTFVLHRVQASCLLGGQIKNPVTHIVVMWPPGFSSVVLLQISDA
jgi:hypothetical protein